MIKAPCYNCTDRHAECHATCEAYKAWAAERREKYESNRKPEAEATAYSVIKATKNKEHSRRKGTRK